MGVRRVAVTAAERLDVVARRALPGLSRRVVRRLIADGLVRVDGELADKGTRVPPGATVTVPDFPAGILPEPELDVPVVYEDADVVAVDKPGGMRGHALDPRQTGTAAAFVLARYPEVAGIGAPLAPGLVHRLDTGTSGLLLVARTPESFAALRLAFRTRRVEKRYLAIVGSAPPSQRVDVPLAHDPADRRRMVAARPGLRGWPATTELQLRVAAEGSALVEAVIRTGVTHQVRAHLALVGTPVVGDALYEGPPAPLPAGRHALHAARLAFPHPRTGRVLVLESPLPADLRALVRGVG